jgi:putative aminopeptidase FrvX
MFLKEKVCMAGLKDLLKLLSEAHAPSGREDEVRSLIIAEAKKSADSLHVDTLGNLYAEIEGSSDRPRLMVATHMDEVGLIVKYVEDKGFLRFETLGTIDPRVLPGQRVVLNGTQQYIGVIGAKPPHVLSPEELKKPVELGELYIDMGMCSREEAKRLGIDIGTTATFDVSFRYIGTGSTVVGKALDNRAGCAAALAVMEALVRRKTAATVTFAFTVQEELGFRGAAVAANHLKPDAAVVLETTVAVDGPDVQSKDMVTVVGRGPAVRVTDAGMITQRLMLDYIKKRAEAEGIPYQLQLYSRGGTDAGPIHLTGEGVPTATLATPCRYLHSPSLMLSLDDLARLVRLAESTIRGIVAPDQFRY